VVMASGMMSSRPRGTSTSGPRLLWRVLTFVRGEQLDNYDSFAALPKL
jgi:hypothetical protein